MWKKGYLPPSKFVTLFYFSPLKNTLDYSLKPLKPLSPLTHTLKKS